MKTKNLIYLGIGGVIAYYLFKKLGTPKDQVEEVEPNGSGIIQGVFVGGVNVPRATNKRLTKQDIINENLNIDVRRGRVAYNKPERPSLIGKKLPKFRNEKATILGIQVPDSITNIFRGKPINVYYANLDRLTPLEVMTPVRYKDRILGTIFVSSIDENNNMTWRNEATGQLVNIIYPTR